MGFAGTPLPTVRGWEHGAQVAAATACCSPPRERWEIFQVKIRAAGAATQLVEYETAVEIERKTGDRRDVFQCRRLHRRSWSQPQAPCVMWRAQLGNWQLAISQ